MAQDGEATGTTRRERLVQRRKALGLTQEDLAGLLGVERSTVVRWELGETEPLPWNRPKLARALHVSADQIPDLLAAGPASPDGPDTASERDDVTQPGGTRAPAVPRQLPAAVADFTGRAAELETLTRILDDAGTGAPGTVVISAIGGTAGVGKTALALHWAHRVAHRFADGQLYVNLRGFDPSGTPASPAEAVRGFLDALGVPPDKVPPLPEAQAGLYRGLVADRTMFILLDNARDERQVRPLLPASPGSLVIVTSRNELAGLAATDGARLLSLDVLPHTEALELLTARVGAGRAGAEPDAIAEIAGLCAYLPLALAVVAARAAARPSFPLSALAAELRDSASRLDAFDSGDSSASVRAVFSWSYQQLSAEAARMFRLLGLHPGPDTSASAAASLTATSQPEARRTLRMLTRAHLVTERASGRYACHDLLRAYAADQARIHDSEDDRRTATLRLLDHYLHTAADAAFILYDGHERVTLATPRPGAIPARHADYEQAMAWYEAEHEVLLASITLAAESGFGRHAWQLAWALFPFFGRRGRYQECAATQRTALAAATRDGDITGRAVSSRLLAYVCNRMGDYDQALAHHTNGLRLYQRLGDRSGQARSHGGLALVAERQERYADALAHEEQALHLYRAMGSREGEAEMLNNIGWFHAHLGDYERARAFCQEALIMNAEFGNRPNEAGTLDSLGYAEHHLGNFREAAACYERALAIRRELSEPWSEALVLTHLGDTHHAAGDLPEARDAWRQALAILSELEHPDAERVRAKLADLDE